MWTEIALGARTEEHPLRAPENATLERYENGWALKVGDERFPLPGVKTKMHLFDEPDLGQGFAWLIAAAPEYYIGFCNSATITIEDVTCGEYAVSFSKPGEQSEVQEVVLDGGDESFEAIDGTLFFLRRTSR